MTTDQIKEQLSNGFVGILAANKGFILDKPSLDYGIDYQLKKAIPYTTPGGDTRYLIDGNYLDIQLKATTEKSITDNGTTIKYKLEAKTFNDLVVRQNNGYAPLILILFILPEDPNLWVEIDDAEIKLRKNAYWYCPPTGSVQTPNTTRITIEIEKANRLAIDCFNELHQKFCLS